MKKLQRPFVALILPTVRKWAYAQFGRRNEDAIAEAVALAWKWAKRLHDLGKDPCLFRSAIARYACRAVRSGRKIAGMLSAKDAMNPITWQRKGFTVLAFPEHDSFSSDDNPFQAAMADHGLADPADHAAFRCDWPRFLAQQPEREQRMADQLAVGEQANVVAGRIGVSPGRLTQLRQRLRDRWHQFHGEAA